MAGKPSDSTSSYLTHLPAVLQTDGVVNGFLRAFEQVLSGTASPTDSQLNSPITIEETATNPPGLEAVIQKIAGYFDPEQTPEEFLPWLSSWVALSLQDNWTLDMKRQFILTAMSRYKQRGTKAGLAQMLQLYLKNSGLFASDDPTRVQVYDRFDRPHYFQVELKLPSPDADLYWKQVGIATAIIDQEKPAHTYYQLKILTPSMRLTGQSVYIPVNQAGTFKVTVVAPVANNYLRLSIRAESEKPLPNQPRPVVSPDLGSVPPEISYTVESPTAIKRLRVVVENLFIPPIDGTVTSAAIKGLELQVTTPDSQEPKLETLDLAPGLKIGKLQNGKFQDGNTLLGTTAR